ncbi:MAG: hypothetical protein GY940_33605 [bacterium]|nr:hypothetical protein [bacterium]
MKPRNIIQLSITVIWTVLGAGLFLAGGLRADDFETGKIIPKVICTAEPDQSYVLYLPSTYSAERQWPILYCFEPAARGPLPVGLFKAAAEKYGYIIVSSNNSRNGPWKPIARAANAMWKDTLKRFPINLNRIYATGLSGGSRVASHFQYIIHRPIAGVIGCGAGLSTTLKPEMLKNAAYFGTVGLEDFNFREMRKLDNAFDAAGVVHRVLVMDGGHRWPPEDICTGAIEWMELNGMKRGIRAKNVLLVTRLYKKALIAAQGLEESGKILEPVLAYDGMRDLFDGLLDVTEARNKAAQLKNSKSYKAFLGGEKKRHKREVAALGAFARTTNLLKGNRLPKRPQKLIRNLKLDDIRLEAHKEGGGVNIYDRALARRLLYEMRVSMMPVAIGYMGKKDYQRAALFFQLAEELEAQHPTLFYNMACAYARIKNKKKALSALNRAVEKGYSNRDYMMKDEDLAYIRNEKAFKEIIRKLSR